MVSVLKGYAVVIWGSLALPVSRGLGVENAKLHAVMVVGAKKGSAYVLEIGWETVAKRKPAVTITAVVKVHVSRENAFVKVGSRAAPVRSSCVLTAAPGMASA